MWPFRKKKVDENNSVELVFENGDRIKVDPEYQENIIKKWDELQKSKNESIEGEKDE